MIDYMKGIDLAELKIWLTKLGSSTEEWTRRIKEMSDERLLLMIFLIAGVFLLIFFGQIFYFKSLLRRDGVKILVQVGKTAAGGGSIPSFETQTKEADKKSEPDDFFESEQEKKEKEQEIDRENEKREEALKKAEEKKKEEKRTEENLSNLKEKEKTEKKRFENARIELDWRKDKLQKSEQITEKDLSYHKTSKKLSDLMGLVMDMLSRGIDDYKIAQTLMYKTQGSVREDDILQLIESIKNFVALGINSRFEVLRKNKSIPPVEAALLHLVEGDTSLALILMESLMDYNISRAAGLKQEGRREAAMIDTSFLSLVFGSLASLTDPKLALEAFELSIELNPKNIGSWNKAADMYANLDMNKKAVWAYENILNNADERAHPRQVAHAKKMLAAHYQQQGEFIHAKKLYDGSRTFYDSIGINKKPERHEIDIIDLIAAKSKSEIKQNVLGLLNIRSLGQYSQI